ncbi:MAG TPA: NAD(P)/FAD-dependent oxidoreductase [Pyrinomonadaceae bacterium]|jgi:2-polyprenyl-6-methoxyphenol hydroxylase-like FAD-dependent oxidoreductase
MGFDAIIVGARCAGSPTAMLLARKGYKVLLVDRAAFPSDTMSTHYIHQPGIARLARWGLLDRVAALDCPPISQAKLDAGSFVLTGSTTAEAGGGGDAYAPRRALLDRILSAAAVEAGAELRQDFSVEDVLTDGARVTGVRGRDRSGATVTERAPIVVGADGLHSVVARSVKAAVYKAKPAATCAYYSYWSGVPLEHAEVYLRPRRVVGAWPTNDGLTVVYVAAPRSEFGKFRADVEAYYRDTISQLPGLGERVRDGRRVERFSGTADLPNFFRKPYGAGWALVGDAGYHRDPITAQGITDAFRDAELLAGAIDDGLGGRQPMEAALAGYERRRNRAVRAMYWFTCYFAAHLVPPGGLRLLQSLRGSQPETNRLFATLAGSVPVADFFSPIHLLRLAMSGYLTPGAKAVQTPGRKTIAPGAADDAGRRGERMAER